MIIDEKDVEKLAELARIELGEREKKEIQADLEKILNYFEELKEVDTEDVEPVSGGTLLTNIHRHDGDGLKTEAERSDLVRAFPEKEGEYLKVPAVFE